VTRPPVIRASFDAFPGELVVDCFAGGGGASTGIEAALGRHVDIAINHDPEAIAMHAANHPTTKHYIEDVWDVDPVEACAGRPVGLAWFSPDCTHHSRAKGGAVRRDKKIRALSWVVTRWARTVRPRVICLENVEELTSWGPLDNDGKPIKAKAGKTFNLWANKLRGLGYEVQFRTLVAADFGTPTTRKRLFMVARCDGRPIVWPEPTHGRGRALPWTAAATVIDWSLPCPSIFGRKRPLAEATLKRIAVGIERFVIGASAPFVMKYHGGADGHQSKRVQPVSEPLRTVDAANRFALVEPFTVKYNGTGRANPLNDPLHTITARDRFALVEPFIVRHGHYSTITGAGLREGCGAGTFRGQPLDQPLATVCATNDKHLVAPLITKHYGGPNGHFVVGHDIRNTLGTITAKDHHACTAALLERGDAEDRSDEVRAFLVKWYGTSKVADLQLPLPTVLSGGGEGGGHLGIVTVRGEPYRIVDIGMRMLAPHELFAAQGFPAAYDIRTGPDGEQLTKTAQTRLAGNSVCPQLSEAIVAANALVDRERAA
jgi:DNA (cytosine-5)-methyltransferase 1